jgi:hypothetical protein
MPREMSTEFMLEHVIFNSLAAEGSTYDRDQVRAQIKSAAVRFEELWDHHIVPEVHLHRDQTTGLWSVDIRPSGMPDMEGPDAS